MKVKEKIRPSIFAYLFIISIFIGNWILLIFGQSSQSENDSFTLKIPVKLVLVPVSVKDKSDKPFYGLKTEDFQVYEEGVPQNITYFSSDPVPLSAVIMIDQSLDAQARSKLNETVLALIESFSDFDEVALFKFDHTPDKVLDFTFDKNKILKSFKTKLGGQSESPGILSGPFSSQTTIGGIPLPNSRGSIQPPKTWNTHIHDAIFSAAQALRRRKGHDSRKMILIISDGKNAPGNRNSFQETLEAVLRTEIIVYGIAQGNSFISRNALSKYATATGGDVFLPIKTETLAKTYQKIIQSARNQYVLGYTPSSSPRSISFRKIQVELKTAFSQTGKVRSRKGYYAIPSP